MSTNPTVYEVEPAPDWFYYDSYYYKLLAHGHPCQCCRRSIIVYDSAQIAFKINRGPNNQQMFGVNIIYNKSNWSVVCSTECVEIVRSKYSSMITQFELAKNIKKLIGRSTGAVKTLKRKKGDGYKESVMRACGLDPSMYTAFKVYPTSEHFDELTSIFSEIFRNKE